MPFVDVTDIVLNEEAKQVEEDMRTDPEIRKAIEQFDMECELRGKILEARKASGLTQIQLEKISGLKQQAISRVEKAGTNSPSINTLMKYLNSIGYKLDVVPK